MRRKNLNEELLSHGYAEIYYMFCDKSEFGAYDRAGKYGCRSSDKKVANLKRVFPLAR